MFVPRLLSLECVVTKLRVVDLQASGNLSIESSFTYTVKGRVTANVRIKLRISQNKKISRQKQLKTILIDKKKITCRELLINIRAPYVNFRKISVRTTI